MPSIHAPGSYITYTPLVQLSYAYVYLLGATTSKLIPALMFLFFLIAFYAVTCRVTNKTAAAIATFFMLITPEMIAFSSLSATNVIHAVSASLGIIYLSLWFKYRERKDFYLASLLLAINIWCRTEGIVFIGASVCAILIDVYRTKQYRDLIIIAASLIPALIWTMFRNVFGLYAESIAIIYPFWDADKANIIFTYMKELFMSTTYYGLTFVVLLASLAMNIKYLIKQKDNMPLLLMFALAVVFYVIVLYQIDYKWDIIENVLSYSAKRFLFCFVPIAWYYSMTNQIVIKGFEKLDDFLSVKNGEK